MTEQTKPQTTAMKQLTKIKLVNWHYFSNETIAVKGSILLCGENASGKSTVLDAIQLVLTTNSRRFNPAAHERGKRDLKGYVRCKTGEEGNAYHRTGAVISYVALEFYEPSRDRYFVLGVKMDSPDVDSEVKRKWFCEEGVMDGLSFIIENRPALDEQFRNNGRKVSFITRTGEARNRFKRRLGNLDDTFFEMIPKSLAFKPMDNVKSFITRFILPERDIDVDLLRENIRHLREMQRLIDDIRAQIAQLEGILQKGDELRSIDRDTRVIEILLLIAERRAEELLREVVDGDLAKARQELTTRQDELTGLKHRMQSQEKELRDILVAISMNEGASLISKYKDSLERLELRRTDAKKRLSELKAQVALAVEAAGFCSAEAELPTVREIHGLTDAAVSRASRNEVAIALKLVFSAEKDRLYSERAAKDAEADALSARMKVLEKEIAGLKERRLTYPDNTLRLKEAIEKEFTALGVDAPVRILADLLEMEKGASRWQDAVEGYLGEDRFDLVVEPREYERAAAVYERLRGRLHSVGLVDTRALQEKADTGGPGMSVSPGSTDSGGSLASSGSQALTGSAGAQASVGSPVPSPSLASLVTSENRWAAAFIEERLGGVCLCDQPSALFDHDAAITPEGFVYEDDVLRKIDPAVYRFPFIGKHAIDRQLVLKQKEYAELDQQATAARDRRKAIQTSLDHLNRCNIELLLSHSGAPDDLAALKDEIKQVRAALAEAERDPNIFRLNQKEAELRSRMDRDLGTADRLSKLVFSLERDIEEGEVKIAEQDRIITEKTAEIEALAAGHETEREEALAKFDLASRQNDVRAIRENFGRRMAALRGQRERRYGELTALQAGYHGGEYGTGEDALDVYIAEHEKLARHDLIAYEEKLAAAQNACELEFRENFLARMRENIEQAETAFKGLNRALRSIYYGNDSYRFHLTSNKLKQSLYEMITSEFNLGSATLFSAHFEQEYKAEMEELFAKLTESDETGEGVLQEYVDYRNYLDYDIEIISRDGKSQFFSKIYGEKSGGETQTPYYVAIAASFTQLYSLGESIRIIMLDEAFDKMDEERIDSMMRFFRSQDLQIILATPPAKMEVIGEHVDTVLAVIREGYSCTIEDFTHV